MSYTNQLVSIALQLQNDLRLTNHKYMAHQTALLYVRRHYWILGQRQLDNRMRS